MWNKKVKSSKAGWLGLIWMSSAHCDERLFQGKAVAWIEGPQCLGLCVNLPPSCSSRLYSRTWLPLIRPCYQLGPCNKAVRKALWESKTYHCFHRWRKRKKKKRSIVFCLQQLLEAGDHGDWTGLPLSLVWCYLMKTFSLIEQYDGKTWTLKKCQSEWHIQCKDSQPLYSCCSHDLKLCLIIPHRYPRSVPYNSECDGGGGGHSQHDLPCGLQW